ncbi:LOW QUALITY PROTEIN: DNA helicase B-like [Leucoraja erinacea]|uniref:LOW QUALITY PROTEIN: DNA helicase B-like n=1 Tax=Leucoraja erinaceus TaxID=7782 RepID=UPI002454A590|nr:LOW QUALITY PROTEIN: DNA helicase B-like [Leucoraja erinacea]
MAAQARSCITVEGYIEPRKDKESEEDSDSEENQEPEEDLQFLDLNDMINVSLGANSVNASSVVGRFVKIKDFGSGETYEVFGRFHLTSPWWKVTAKIHCHQKKWKLHGYPSYALVHPGQNGTSIISLFLTKCRVHSDYITTLFYYFPRFDNLQFSKLFSILQQTADEGEDENKKDFATSIIASISSSVEGQNVQKAVKFQSLMKYLPQLLPRHFLRILKMDDNKLWSLDQMICTEMWKLGFSSILTKEVRLVGCEATLLAFEEASLLTTIPELQRHSLVIYDKLKQTCWDKGHTYVNVDDLTGLRPSEVNIESEWESLNFLKESEIIVIEKKRVYLQRFYNYEKEIATCIKELVDKPPMQMPVSVKEVLRDAFVQTQSDYLWKDNEVDDTEHSKTINLDEEQVKAATMMCKNPVTIISGKGGCGKTTIVSLAFKAAVEKMKRAEDEELLQACEDLEQDQSAPESWVIPKTPTTRTDGVEPNDDSKAVVLFTAPTGKAASLLKKKTGFNAYTLHQVMWSFSFAKYSKEKPKVFDWMFSEVQVLIVDEGSLVSVKTLSTVLKSLMKYANLKKLIILGDIRQLPSIEPGNMFKDIYFSLYNIGWAIDLSINHRAESQLIVENAARIAEIGLKSTYKKLEYDAVLPISSGIGISIPASDKKFILVLIDSGQSLVLQDSINVLLGLDNVIAPGLENHVTSQFIAFRRKDCELINELCCKKYSGHPTKDHKKRLDFRVGDKVCCTRNAYVEDFTEMSKTESETDSKGMKENYRLCNGEIFFITEDKIIRTNTSTTRYLLLDDKENKQILVNFEELRKKCKLAHAWARTIHTFQGSEADTVVYVVGPAGRQNWQHIYTAVTRGRKRVYVVTSEAHFIKAMKARVTPRNTRLREFLQEKLAKPGAASCSEGSQFQQQASYCWSSSVELDNRECNGACVRPDEAVNSLPHSDDTSTRESLVMTTDETDSKTIEANWSPGCKRSDNTSAGEGSTAKYSKILMESPLGCTKFEMTVLDNSSPPVNAGKRLFTEENK